MSTSNTDPLTQIGVHAAVLHATADLLELLGSFLTTAEATIHTQLGIHVLAHHDAEATTDPRLAAALTLAAIDEAAELLHALAHSGDTDR